MITEPKRHARPKPSPSDQEKELLANLRKNKAMQYRVTFKDEPSYRAAVAPFGDGSEGSEGPDTLTAEAKIPVPAGFSIRMAVSPTLEGLGTAEEVPLMNATLTETTNARGRFWWDGTHFIFVFGNRGFHLPVMSEKVGGELNLRNLRMGVPSLFNEPICPECGRPFVPSREGQIYDRRACADRAGAKRRRRERKETSV